jgi:replicative DNA helicase
VDVVSELGVRELPKNVDAEQQILGSFLLDPEGTLVELNMLRPEQFYLRRHRVIFRAMRALADSGATHDIIAVANRLKEVGDTERAGGLVYLNELLGRITTTVGLEGYVEIVRDDAVRRWLIERAGILQEAAYNEAEGMDGVRVAADAITMALIEGDRRGIATTADVVDAVHREMVETLHTGRFGITTGFAGLDHHLRGLKAGYYILAGRPGEGKSSLALNMAWRQTNTRDATTGRPIRVGFISLEMTLEELNKRLVSIVMNKDWSRIPAGLTREYWEMELKRAGMEIALHPIIVDDRPHTTIEKVVSSAMEMRLKHHIDILYVDYLQLLHSGSRFESRNQEVGAISRRIMVLHKQLEIPVVVLSQLSRENVKGHGRRPDLQDLRESGSLEQDADAVLFTYDAKKHMADDTAPHELILAKYRYGATGLIEMYWNKSAGRFEDLARDSGAQEKRDWTEGKDRE